MQKKAPQLDPALWKDLDPKEREIFARILTREAEVAVEKKDLSLLPHFSLARTISPKDLNLCLLHTNFLSKENDPPSLKEALKAANATLKLDADNIEPLIHKGAILLKLGIHTPKSRYFQRAEKTYQTLTAKYKQQELPIPPRCLL